MLSWTQRRVAGDGALHRFLHAPPETGRRLIEEIRDGIAEEAQAAREPTEAFAPTLLAAIVGLERSLIVQLGDGAIVHRKIGDPAWQLALQAIAENARTKQFASPRSGLVESSVPPSFPRPSPTSH